MTVESIRYFCNIDQKKYRIYVLLYAFTKFDQFGFRFQENIYDTLLEIISRIDVDQRRFD